MAEIHFRSKEEPQNKSDVTNRLGDSDFVLAVSKGFLRKCDRFELIHDFGSLYHGWNPFPMDGSIAEQKWRHHSISGWRFSYSLSRNFPSILLRSKVIQEFHACAMVKKFFHFLEANMTPNISFANLETPKRHFLQKICVNWGIMIHVAIPDRAAGLPKNKKER
jgi:hypothetical protein